MLPNAIVVYGASSARINPEYKEACTILQQENDDTVQAFLAEHPEFELVKTTTARKVKDTRHSPTLTILPSDFNSDGFFISSLKKGI